MYGLVRPLLFTLDAERAHHLGLGVAECIARRRWLTRWLHAPLPNASPIHAFGLTFEHPVGLAPGLDKNAVATAAWWAFGFSFVELGTVTPRPQAGNPKPRMFRVVDRLGIVNRMGFNNDGMEAVANRLRQQKEQGLRPPMPIGISVGKNKDTPNERAMEDYVQATTTLAPWADFITINISSPNTVGLRDLQTPESVANLVRSVREAAAGKPVLLKLAPEITGDGMKEILDAAVGAGCAGFILTNTLKVGAPENLPEGGLSGRPLRATALMRVAEARQHLGPSVPLIGVGGIDDAESAQAMLRAGAQLVQIYTGLVYRGPFLPRRIAREMSRPN